MIKLPEGTAAGFNQWMKDVIDHAGKYRQEWESIRAFISTADGVAPDYGQSCVVLLERLLENKDADVAINDPQPAEVTS